MNFSREDMIMGLYCSRNEPCVYEAEYRRKEGRKYKRYKTTFTAYSLEEACCRVLAQEIFAGDVFTLKDVVIAFNLDSFKYYYPCLREFTLNELLETIKRFNYYSATGVYFFKNVTKNDCIIDYRNTLKGCLHGKVEKRIYNLEWKD